METPGTREISGLVASAAAEVVATTCLGRDGILVVGCSTSEIRGKPVGSAGDMGYAIAVLTPLLELSAATGFSLAIQCCEHLNRALVVERLLARQLGIPTVSVIPVVDAGGALAAAAMDMMVDPVVVEDIKADVGIDIGHTLIGMHLRPVAVPLRISVERVGHACLVAAGSRPRLIGGGRSHYPADRWGRSE